MDFYDKISDKKEELLDEFENLTLEEIALRQNWITPEIIIKHSDDMKSDYGLYVKKLLK